MSTLSTAQEEAKEYAPRFKLLYICLGITSVLIFSRLWYLQIIKGQELRTFSEKNRVKERKIPAPRGLMLDRDGRILVENLPGFEATISPQYATKLDETAETVGKIIDLPASEIVREVKQSRRKNGPFLPVVIKDNLSLDEVVRLSALRFDYPGLDINQAILRHYPLSEIGAQLFGYVGEISKNQIQEYNKKFQDSFFFEQGDIIGKNGLEEVWEPDLKGSKGVSYVEVDAHGRESNTDSSNYWGLKEQDDVPGNNLVLTIDKDIQEAAYKAMFREDKVGNRIGSVVAIKSNGEILAWVNTPSYNPNNFSKGISNEIWGTLINDPNKPLRNKVVQDHYSPGSTFKPFVALAALQEGKIQENTKIYSPGSLAFGRRVYHDHTKHGHGNINVVQALERSSNIFFYKMGIELGIDNIAKYVNLFGIGQRTGVQLPNEASGNMPTTDWKLKAKGEEWQPGENLSNAIGQGFVLTTTLQMALAYNAIATEGKLFKPLLVKKIIDHNNKMKKEFYPEVVADISDPSSETYIDKKNFKTVKKGLEAVVNSDRGTARWSARLHKLPKTKLAGKTGTIQLVSFSADQIYEKCQDRPFEQRHHGAFVGFAPADNPEITVAVYAEHSCAGSSGAGPVARDVVYAYLEKYHPQLFDKKKKKNSLPTPLKKDPVPPNSEEEEED